MQHECKNKLHNLNRARAKTQIANAAMQAHLQAHKTHSTEANLPKSLTSCSAWVTVLRLAQLKYNIQQTDIVKGERITGSFESAGTTNKYSSFVSSVSSSSGLDVFHMLCRKQSCDC